MTRRAIPAWHRAMVAGAMGALALAACDPEPTPDDPKATLPDLTEVAVSPGPPVMKRLTNEQFARAVRGLFGEDLFVPADIEPEFRVDGLNAVGAAVTSISPRGIERYEAAAFDIAEQAMTPPFRARWLSCDPAAASCALEAFEALGLRMWRRPLTDAELDALVGLVDEADAAIGDADEAMQFGLAAMLQSPYFLLRPELGEDDPEGDHLRLTAWELATRLSFLLWNAPPDDELLAAAADGSLVTPSGLDGQAVRMLADPRAREGIRAFVADWLHLDLLDDMEKDAGIYLHYSDRVGPSAREETQRVVERIVFDDDSDLRDLFTTRRTFVDRTLAAIYGVKAPERDGFGEIELPEDGDRRGYLGQVSFLAGYSHFNSTSPTLRGAFVREHILCQAVPDPPAGVNTAIPEATEQAATLRDRVQAHMEDPTCRSCHQIFDPIGLAAENYDGIGVRRELDNGAPIDASGSLDGTEFNTLSDLAEALHAHPRLPACNLAKLTRYALGRRADDGEQDLMEAMTTLYAARDHRLQPLLLEFVQTPLFRTIDPARAVDPVSDTEEEAP